jgi:Zn-dependent protease
MPDWIDIETAIILAVLAGFAVWALRRQQKIRLSRTFRVYPEDLWDLLHFHRDKDNWMFGMDRIEWDEGSDVDGTVYYTAGLIGLMKQRIDVDAMRAASSIEIVTKGTAPGERMVSLASIDANAAGTRCSLEMVIERIGPLGFKGWLSRLLRPLSLLALGRIINNELERNGALARYAADHGEPPAERSILGMRLSRNALLLAIVALGWWGWSFGVWFTVALAVGLVLHEAGHVAVMRIFGDRTSAFYFVPFLGGVAIGKMKHASDLQHLLVVLGGPFAGLISAVVAAIIGWWLDNDFFLACGYFFALFNLFNLVPVPPLDGGQITMLTLRPFFAPKALHIINVSLLAAGAALSFWLQSKVLLIIFALLCVLAIAFPKQHTLATRPPLSKRGAVASLCAIVMLAGLLVLVMSVIGQSMSFSGAAYALKAGPFDD